MPLLLHFQPPKPGSIAPHTAHRATHSSRAACCSRCSSCCHSRAAWLSISRCTCRPPRLGGSAGGGTSCMSHEPRQSFRGLVEVPSHSPCFTR